MTKKLFTLLLLISAGAIMYYLNTSQEAVSIDLKLNPVRRLLCYLRRGDHVHPGDEKAIDLIMEKALKFDPSLKRKATLDVGCGFGGTVQYLAKHGFKNVQGCDIDQPSIEYCKKTYPNYNFWVGNILGIKHQATPHSISFFTLLSVAYAIEDKKTMLNSMSSLAAPGAIFAIWDYTYPNSSEKAGVYDAANASMHAIVPYKFHALLDETGWELLLEQDWSNYFSESYTITLQKLDEEEVVLEKLFTPKVVAQTRSIYQAIKNNMESGALGGTLIIAKKRP